MKIRVVNTSVGFRLCDEEDAELASRLKPGAVYVADIKEDRNPKLHRKFMALIKAAWDMQGEKVCEHFHNDLDGFRYAVEIAAGYYTTVYNLERKEWMQIPKSIRFDAMDETEFRDLYEKVKGTIIKYFCYGEHEQEKINYINNF